MNRVSRLLHALADDTRLRILALLLEGDVTVSELAARLDLPQPRVSAHLAILREVGLVSVEQSGRQRAYHVDRERLLPLFAALVRLTPGEDMTMTTSLPPRSTQASRLVRNDVPIRHARTCYDHLAGVLGVRLMDELLGRGWLEIDHDDGKRSHYRLTDEGRRALAARGVDVAGAETSRRMHAYGCTDWTERRPHLGGSLGAAILEAIQGAGLVARTPGDRTVSVIGSLDDWLAG
ncbi:MAG TPA: metalloregulator ArsR/SmtB family transcription factor [Thermomicrobiales bacterium]|nr:metalloregulator ArsR/SmtB family transcription factor [Thermomicrobiales bacterium]